MPPQVFELPPTIMEPVCQCAVGVQLEGTRPGSVYVVEVDPREGVLSTFMAVAMSTTTMVPVSALGLGDRVRAASFTPGVLFPFGTWSAPVVAQRIRSSQPWVPGVPALPPWVDPRAQAVLVLGVYPGCTAVVHHRPGSSSVGTAGPDGRARVEWVGPAGSVGLMGASQQACAASVGTSAFEYFQAPPWQELTAEAYAGQTELRVRNTTAGSTVQVTAATGALLGERVAVDTEVVVVLSGPMSAGALVTLHQRLPGFFGAPGLAPLPASTGPTTVVQVRGADELQPRLRGPVLAGDDVLFVDGLVPGAQIAVFVYEQVLSLFSGFVQQLQTVYPWRVASYEPRIRLVAPLPTVGTVVVLAQLAGTTVWADDADIEPVNAFRDPVIVPNVFDCALVVQVLTVPGAEVILEQDGVFVGQARCTSELAHVAVPVVKLRGGAELIARQILPGNEKVSAKVVVRAQGVPATPRILPPFAPEHRQMWVSSVTPGSIVWVRTKSRGVPGAFHGWTVAADPVLAIPTVPLADEPYVARGRLCDEGPESAPERPQPDPTQTGPFEVTEYAFETVDPSGVALEGQAYAPRDPVTGVLPASLAGLLVIGHGDAPSVGVPGVTDERGSYEGYGYLARHLASFGWLVFSGAGPFDGSTTGGFDKFLEAIDLFQSLSASRLGGAPTVVLGHSLGSKNMVEALRADIAQGSPRGVSAGSCRPR